MSQETLACTRCLPTETENAHLRAALESLQQENTNLSMEIAGARTTLRTVERQLAKARADLTQTLQDSPQAKTIESVFALWQSATGHKRAKLTDEARKLIRGQLRHFDADHLGMAIMGVALLPYKPFRDRSATGQKEHLRTQLDDCIGPKPPHRIEDNIDVYRRHCKLAVLQADLMWDQCQQIQAQSMVWMNLMTGVPEALAAGVKTDDLEVWLLDRERERNERRLAINALPVDELVAEGERLGKPMLELVREAA